jgi:hypothetical protein
VGVRRLEVLWRRKATDRLTSGTDLRHMLARDDPNWRRLVPSSVERCIDEIGIATVRRRVGASG